MSNWALIIYCGIITSGLTATFGYNFIPFKAYVIVAALTGLLIAMILTRQVKTK